MTKLKNIHPGEILLEEFLLPMCISQNKLARDIDVSPRRINEIVHGLRAITADTDLRLSCALGTSEGFWLGLQIDYDLEERKKAIGEKLKQIEPLHYMEDDHQSAHGLQRKNTPKYKADSSKKEEKPIRKKAAHVKNSHNNKKAA